MKPLPPLPPVVKKCFDALYEKRKEGTYYCRPFDDWLKASHTNTHFIDIVYYSYLYAIDAHYGEIFDYHPTQLSRHHLLPTILEELSLSEAQLFLAKLPNALKGKVHATIIQQHAADPSDRHTHLAAVSSLDDARPAQKRKIFKTAWKNGNINALDYFIQPEYLDAFTQILNSDQRVSDDIYTTVEFVQRFVGTFPTLKDKLYTKIFDEGERLWWETTYENTPETKIQKQFLQELFLHQMKQPDIAERWADCDTDFWMGVYKLCPPSAELTSKMQDLVWNRQLSEATEFAK